MILVHAATKSKKGYRILRDYIRPLVIEIAGHYSSVEGKGSEVQALSKAGLVYFDYALACYVERLGSPEGRGYKFSTYYTWYIKQSMETYLGIAKEPLEGIPQRAIRSSTHPQG